MMCDTCGCSAQQDPEQDAPSLTVLNDSGSHDHNVSVQSLSVVEAESRLDLSVSLLNANERMAASNRKDFQRHNVLAINLMSAPGAGKTTLLETTLSALKEKGVRCAVIEGDQATLNDAERIRATGCPVVQINTGAGCHLEANMVREACQKLSMADTSLLFIENVGNLVCPSLFDLGEAKKVVLLSVTEGDDKPLKYPHIFRGCDYVIINKCDLLPYVNFDLDSCRERIRQLNVGAEVITLSANQPESLGEWLRLLE